MKRISKAKSKIVKSLSFCKICAIITLMLLISINSNAQQDERKGFILGLGIGPGVLNYKLKVDRGNYSIHYNRVKKLPVMSNFKIGYAPNENLAIYWTAKVSWFRSEKIQEEPRDIMVSGVAGIGVTYYLKEEAPSVYFNGGVGYSTFSALSLEDDLSNNHMGFGFSAGAGYEFAKHWSGEVNIAIGSPGKEEFTYQVTALAITFNYLLY
jgi:opacity protein-like surface antigen